MKQLVKRMPKKEQKPKKKPSPKLSQKQRFIEYAKKVEADETGETFKKAIKKVLPATQED